MARPDSLSHRGQDVHVTVVEDHLRAEIRRRGPLPYAEVVDAALYLPGGGFYATGGRAGRRGDFLTSPEVGQLFGAVVARALDAAWADAGEPAVFRVVEEGAGPGTLATSVMAASPRCSRALRYVLVETSATQRAHHADRLRLDDPAQAFASWDLPSDDTPTPPAPPAGPIVVSLEEPPRLPGPCLVLANELLDNLPFDLVERTHDGWADVRVGLRGKTLVETLVVLPPRETDWLHGVAPDARPGARVPIAGAAAAWVREARLLAGAGGRVLAVDYCSTTAELAHRPCTEWVRSYRSHTRGGPPLTHLGSQDITCEVPVDQLPPTDADRSQTDWLRFHGLAELVEEARVAWRERAAVGDLEAVRARSRVSEAEALTDPDGLGAFRVLEWAGR